jgi:hypothetical protein
MDVKFGFIYNMDVFSRIPLVPIKLELLEIFCFFFYTYCYNFCSILMSVFSGMVISFVILCLYFSVFLSHIKINLFGGR